MSAADRFIYLEDCAVHRFTAMGCPCIVAVTKKDDRLALTGEEEVRRIEAKYSRFDDVSTLSRLNRQARAAREPVDAETAALLHYGQACFEHSGGRFDITAGALTPLWRWDTDRLPTSGQLALALEGVGFEKLGFDGQSVHYQHPSVALDFGGIAKEYAVDRVVEQLMAAGVAFGWVNLGGDMRVWGGCLNVGVRAPVKGQMTAAATYGLPGAMATSGDYERCMWVDGVRYSHLIDPTTGWPVREGLASVSVVADQCMVAGSLATMATLMPEREALEWLSGQGLEYLALSHDGSVAGSVVAQGDALSLSPTD